MTRPYRRISTEEQAAFGAADWSTPWKTAQALGARLGRDPRVVLMWAQRRGLAPLERKRIVGPEDVRAIREGFEAGLLGPTIARKLGLHPETIRRVAIREGFEPGQVRDHRWADGVCTRCDMRATWPGARAVCRGVG